MRILLKKKVEICIKMDSQCKNTHYYLKRLKLAMLKAKMKKEMWFYIKCNNISK